MDEEEEFSNAAYSFDSFKTNSETKKIIDAINSQLNIMNSKLSDKRIKSIVIEGPSRLGKTEFILSYLSHLNLHYNYTRGEFDFSKENHKNAYKVSIFDDISIPEIRRVGLLKNIIGGQRGFEYNVKYAPKRTVLMRNRLSIFLVNPDISFEDYCKWSCNNNHRFHEYIEDNCILKYPKKMKPVKNNKITKLFID
ncbi:phage terminase large subunit family protein ['Fragaria x ananassa' phyllody phytoplasma]|uniref:phage terminase large subunit family protein n=1 Tax='Fragaria x ananassa' phyllody phytoplasma TaxID=2358428 RepID=UPI001CECCEBA|nr:phage terminase large subunit family protein ['Fragaria x ananassa' phyllody phytoplasma]